MSTNRVFLAFALSASAAAQSDLPIVNLGGSCGAAVLNIAVSPSFLTFTVAPPNFALLVIGFTDPAFAIPGCPPCVLHASLDISFFMLPATPLQLGVPPLVFTIYAQAAALFAGGCTTFVPGVPFTLTDGFQIW